ncbi:MAG: DUF58 domain-containing protein [Myxococcota bacterium]|nr:DUF58 domain-containing protein [Myxococcota bacterium]
MNYARLNHILIPSTKEGRDRLRSTRFAKLFFGPPARTWLALTAEGRGLLGISIVAGLMGLDVMRGQNHLLWALAFSLVVASLAVRPFFRLNGLRVEVEGPARVAVGGEARFLVHLSNHARTSHHGLRVTRPFLPWDGKWISGEESVAALAAETGRETSSWVARFSARGHHHIDSFSVGARVPLGLAVGPAIESRGTRFVVVPRMARVSLLGGFDAPKHQPGGVQRASQTGESMELVGLREYRNGDRLRDLHARSWARLGVPIVREYQQEYFSRVALVLDDDGAVGSEEQLEAAISVVAGLAGALCQGDALVDLMTLGERREPLTLGRSLGGLDAALDRLAAIEHAPLEDEAGSFDSLGRRLGSVSGVIFVALAWNGARSAFVDHVRRTGVPCRAVVVADAPAEPGAMRTEPPRFIEPARVRASCELGEEIVL